MPRMFNVEVFNKTIGGASSNPPEYRSGEEFYDQLGSADNVIAQVFIDSAATVPTTVTVSYEMSNSVEEETWTVAEVDGSPPTPLTETVTVTSMAPAPQSESIGWVTMAAFVPAAYGRFVVTSDEPEVAVRIVACGRANG